MLFPFGEGILIVVCAPSAFGTSPKWDNKKYSKNCMYSIVPFGGGRVGVESAPIQAIFGLSDCPRL
jgi:hypothetical protein